ncbi:hypothetical protein Pint_05916 [Pistacia integerrima]|uniref:Uncharacterized protein n=1 Tax=Pistacia integerrima TaxID=434235 RepID=A0ACC0Z363_9ROSI|nr:hypothetical protein Pint_05916 [Pistacia integerrima]
MAIHSHSRLHSHCKTLRTNNHQNKQPSSTQPSENISAS